MISAAGISNPTPGGGLSGARSFVVASSTVASVEFVGVTTAILTTGSADGFYVRFRDAFGNLVDVDRPVVRFTNDDGSSTGTITLRRSSLGVSTATTTIFTVDGTYTLSVDNIPTTLGNTTLVVQTGTDFFTRFENVPQAITAGGTVQTFRLTYKDRFGNFTDRGLGDVTLRSGSAAAGRIYTVPMTRLSTGVYESQPFSYTTAGTYYVRVAGIVLANVSYISSTATLVEGDAPSFRVLPAQPIVEFRSVDMDLVAGGSQPAFVLVIRDEFGNDVPSPDVLTVNYTNTTSATGGIRASTGTITLPLRTGRINVYDAPVTRLEWQGAYTMDIAGYSLYKGNRQFVVRALSVQAVDFAGLPTTATIGNIPPVTISFRDRYDNLVDRQSLLTFSKMSGAPASTGTIELTRTALGVSTATLLSLSDEGTYSLKVSGMTAIPIRGNNNVILIYEGEITSACFSVTPERIPAGTAPVIQAWYTLTGGERAFTHPREVIYTHSPSGMTGTIPMYRVGVGTSQSRPELQPFTLAGTYTLSVANPPSLPSCETTFVVEGGTAASITTTAAPLECLTTAGESLTPLSFEVRDRWGNLTNAFNNVTLQPTPIIGTFTGTGLNGVSTGTVLLTTLATGTLTEIVQPRIFTTAGTYSMTVPIYSAGTQIASTTVTFCVQPDVAAIGILTNVTPTILVNGTQTPVLTVRDRWGNLTNYAGTLSYNGAASGTIALTQRSQGVYDGATTAFGVGGDYTLAAGMLTMRGLTTFVVGTGRAVSVTFENVRSGLSVYEPQSTIRTVFRDAGGNLTDDINITPLAITLRLPDNTTVLLTLQQVSQGVYTITQPTTGFDQSGLFALRVGALTVLDQGFFSVAAPEFLGSLARINIVGRNYGGSNTLSDTPGYNTFLDNDGLDFDTVRVGTRSLPQNWEMVYKGMNRLRVSSLPLGFEVSSDNGATWVTTVGGILQLPSTQGSINLPSMP